MTAKPESPLAARPDAPDTTGPGDPRIDGIAPHVKEIIRRILGLSPPETDPNLTGTDRRVAKMYLEIFSGL